MDSIERLKQIDLVEHIGLFLQKGKTDKGRVLFHSGKEDKNASLVVYPENNYNDFSGRLGGGTIIDFQMKFDNIEKSEAIKKLCEKYGISDNEKKEFKKAPKRIELVEKFEDFRLKGTITQFSRFLQTRGFSFDLISEFKEQINEVAKEIGFSENQFVDQNTFKDVLIFPCLNENKEIIGAKLRRCDGEKILHLDDYLKSIAIKSTGLIYSYISEKYVLICEGETDYLILKILGFNSLIGNLGGVSSNAEKIKQLVKNTERIVCLYDNDGPGQKGALSLEEKIGRPIRNVIYKKIDGFEKYDVNDLFKMGYRREDFKDLIQNAELLDKEKIIEKIESFEKEIKQEKNEEKQKLFKNRYFYDDTKMKYFDLKDFSFCSTYDISQHLLIKPKDMNELRKKGAIPTYEGTCYFDGGKKGFYNLLDKSQIAHPSKNPNLDNEIKFLIGNLCNFDEKNIEWLEKAILYKYTHLNDVFIPAVIFHGVGGTGKGLFVDLLEQIFGQNNTLSGLRQENIESRFSIYTGQKLIVEFIELNVESFQKGKKNTNKLKSIIMEDTIQIEKKGQDPISTENIAWFILSSNESKPIQLDGVDTGNRRFSVIKTGKFIPRDKGNLIAKSIKNKDNIENFLAYLFEKYKEIPNSTSILPLDNQDKRDLEYLSESVGNLFFKWVEEKYPNIKKITNHERESLLEIYRIEIGETEWTDDRYKVQYFNSGLSVRYKPTSLQIRGKVVRGYIIDKDVSGEGEFPDGFFDKPQERPKGVL